MLLLTAIAGANDHKGLAGPTSRNKQSCNNLIFFLGKVRDIFWELRFLLKLFKFEKSNALFTDDAWKAVDKWG